MNTKYGRILDKSKRYWKFQLLDVLLEYSVGTLLPAPFGVLQDLLMLLSPEYFRSNLTPHNKFFVSKLLEKIRDNDMYMADDWLELLHEEVRGERQWSSRFWCSWFISSLRVSVRVTQAPQDLAQDCPDDRPTINAQRDCAQAVCVALSSWSASKSLAQRVAASGLPVFSRDRHLSASSSVFAQGHSVDWNSNATNCILVLHTQHSHLDTGLDQQSSYTHSVTFSFSLPCSLLYQCSMCRRKLLHIEHW
jgi:hypothetical protein